PVWGLDRIDQRSLPLSSSYESRSAAAVTAYVLDTGVRVGHAEFGGRARNGWDFIDADAVANDCHGHGTHVAGTIGGATYGVAKDVEIVGVRVLDCHGSGSYSQIIAGVDWVTTHAVLPAVANVSLGGPGDRALDEAVQRSIAAGVTYAVAAGNDDTQACNDSPGRTPAAITVGATDSTDRRAWFSNYGRCVDIFAPGVRITSARHTSTTATTVMSGTSMAAPHVAGAAALVLAAAPTSTPAQVRDALVAQATAGTVAARGAGSPNLLLYTGGISSDPAPSPAVTPPPVAPCGPFVVRRDVVIRDLATVTSARKVTGCAGAASATSSVRVVVKHRHRGSLVVTLIAPNGAAYFLKTATSDPGDDLVATYPVDASGAPRNGTWTLTVRDTLRRDIGYLDAWSLTL
ncbi:MAG TPA: S8 family serine peptidase, partial [Actinoplanes sp.]|nr:S8 family serine peptidase [Actinoplanes sp.]